MTIKFNISLSGQCILLIDKTLRHLEAFQFLSGGAGGFVRGIVGVTKDKTFNPDTFKFQWKSFAITIVVSIIVGQMSGLILNADWRMSLLASYAGSDFLESIYKLSFAKFFK